MAVLLLLLLVCLLVVLGSVVMQARGRWLAVGEMQGQRPAPSRAWLLLVVVMPRGRLPSRVRNFLSLLSQQRMAAVVDSPGQQL